MQSRKGISNIYGQKIAWTVFVGAMGAVLQWSYVAVKRPGKSSNAGYQGGLTLKGRQVADATAALGGSVFGVESIIQGEIDKYIALAQGPITAEMRDGLKWTDQLGVR